MRASTRQPWSCSQSIDRRATSSVIPLTLLLNDQQYQQSTLHLYSTNRYAVIGWNSPGITRDRIYGTSQPRALRAISAADQCRFAGVVSGPGSASFSGYCGNTASGRVAPFGCGGAGGWAEERSNRSLTVTSTRNA